MKAALSIGGLLLTSALITSTIRSQVVISEIGFDSKDQWIEIYNPTQKTFTLTGWSIYQATLTKNKPQNYWFGFPKGTQIDGGAFLRVHWLSPIKPSTKTDLYTGNTVFHFLFGLFAESLDPSKGALALMNTQSNTKMNTASSFKDWVSWGTSGFKRETLAGVNNLWLKNSFAPVPSGTPLPSLAYDYSTLGKIHSGKEWFLDGTPTPGKGNTGGAFVKTYGTSCNSGLSTLANLTAIGIPASGAKNFSVGIDRTLSPQEFAIFFVGPKPGNGAAKIFACSYWLDPLSPVIIGLLPKVGGQARFPLNASAIANFSGVHVYMTMGVVIPGTNKAGLTNGLEIQFGK